MPQSTFNSNETHTPNALWKTPVRLLHWLTAASMAGAAILTSQGDIGHAALGWIALGALLIQLFGCRNDCTPSPTLWLVTADVVILDLSGLLAPQGTIHLSATLVVLVLAALYCAAVLFESLQRVTTRTGIQTASARGRDSAKPVESEHTLESTGCAISHPFPCSNRLLSDPPAARSVPSCP